MTLTPEEAQLTGIANQIVGNNLSSVWVEKNSRGHNYGCKAYSEDIHKAKEAVDIVMQSLKEKYP